MDIKNYVSIVMSAKTIIKQQQSNLEYVVAMARQTRGAIRVVLELFGYFFFQEKK